MQITKSTRHSRYIGWFGEALVCNMLSRSGFEVMHVDHVGVDVIAERSDYGRIGISVKSRTRDAAAKEADSVNLLTADDTRLKEACKAFGLKPWLAVYVETEAGADLYLTSLLHYRQSYSRSAWSMSQKAKARYADDAEVLHLSLGFKQEPWFEHRQT